MNKLVVISIDALQTQDLEIMKTLPSFSQILEKAAIVTNVREVYPTLTNVNHVSIITGVTPDKHGVYHNSHPYVPNKDSQWNVIGYNWMWERSSIKCKTIVDAAKENGLTTCCCTWPSMGGTDEGVAHWNIAEIWPHLFATVKESYTASSTQNAMDKYYDKYIAPFDFARSFDVDPFNVDIACDMLETIKPDLLLHHIISLDAVRHKNGNCTEKLPMVFARIDDFIGKIITATKNAGTFENTNFVLLGDHGQMDIKAQFNINTELAKRGLLTEENGLCTDYTAYSFSCGFSSLIIMKNPNSAQDKEMVYNALEQIRNEYPMYIEKIYTENEASAQGLAGDFTFVVETQEGITLGNALSGKLVQVPNDDDYVGYKSNHGYHPSKGTKPLFIASGPDIKSGAVQDNVSILQECSTFAKLLNIDFEQAKEPAFDIFK